MNQYYPNQVLRVPNATPSTTDAAQYMYRVTKAGKVANYNLCGHFCVAFCMRDEAHTDNVDEFLNYWEVTALKWYETAFNKGLGRRTGINDLKAMLDAYGAKYLDLSLPSKPIAYLAMLDKYQLIAGVSIDSPVGYLVGQGIRHWEVLDRIMVIDESHAICDLYNPFTNAMEPYSWRELMNSTGPYKQGLWVERLRDGF